MAEVRISQELLNQEPKLVKFLCDCLPGWTEPTPDSPYVKKYGVDLPGDIDVMIMRGRVSADQLPAGAVVCDKLFKGRHTAYYESSSPFEYEVATRDDRKWRKL